MTKQDYLKLLVESIHSTTIATIGADSHPQTRVIDMMLWDEQGVYFLTAKGKAFYAQLMEQGFIALSATKDKISISLRGKIRNIGSEKLDEIFEKNTYMQSIYPGDTHNDACKDAGGQRSFLRFMAFIDETRSDHIGCAHQEVGDLANASGGGGQKLQGVFDKFNQQTGERSKGKCADECRKVR